jgi:excisionase family DNA binding protein
MMIFRALIDHKVLTADEVAKHLKVSGKTVYRLAKSGKLPYVKWGRAVRFLERDVEAFIQAQGRRRSNGVVDS